MFSLSGHSGCRGQTGGGVRSPPVWTQTCTPSCRNRKGNRFNRVPEQAPPVGLPVIAVWFRRHDVPVETVTVEKPGSLGRCGQCLCRLAEANQRVSWAKWFLN